MPKMPLMNKTSPPAKTRSVDARLEHQGVEIAERIDAIAYMLRACACQARMAFSTLAQERAFEDDYHFDEQLEMIDKLINQVSFGAEDAEKIIGNLAGMRMRFRVVVDDRELDE